MADSAFQTQYRQEFIAQFEQGQSWLRNVCTTEAVIKGNQAMFLGGYISASDFPQDISALMEVECARVCLSLRLVPRYGGSVGSGRATIVGGASVLIQGGGLNVLTGPVWSER
jgi:hypothetical protein